MKNVWPATGNINASHHPGNGGGVGRCVRTAFIIVMSVGISPIALAENKGSGLENGAVVIYSNPDDQRRAELRRALVRSDELPDRGHERRRLSPEERSSLNLELREAVRDAYRQRNSSDR